MGLSVAVANIFKLKGAIEAGEPAGGSKEHLCEWGVDVKVVLAQDVVGSEFAKMNLVETGRYVRTRHIGEKKETDTTWSGWLIL